MTERLKFFLSLNDASPQAFELLTDGSHEVVLGRGKKSDFVVEHSSVSWTHLKFRAHPGILTVRDVSSNGCGLQAPSNPELQVLQKNADTPVPDGALLVLPKRVCIAVRIPQCETVGNGGHGWLEEGQALTAESRTGVSSDDDLEAMEAKLGVSTIKSKACQIEVVSPLVDSVSPKSLAAQVLPQVDRSDDEPPVSSSRPPLVQSGVGAEPAERLGRPSARQVDEAAPHVGCKVDLEVVSTVSKTQQGLPEEDVLSMPFERSRSRSLGRTLADEILVREDGHESSTRSQDGENHRAERFPRSSTRSQDGENHRAERFPSRTKSPVRASLSLSANRSVEKPVKQRSRSRSPMRCSMSVERQLQVHPDLPVWVQEGQHAQWWSQSKAVMLSVTVSKIDVAKRVVIAVFDADGSSWKSVPFSMFSRKDCPLHPMPGKLQQSRAPSAGTDVHTRRRSRTPDWWEEEKRKQKQAAADLRVQQEAAERESKEAFERHLEEQKRKALMEAERKKVEEAFERRKKEAETLQMQEEEAWRQRLREEREKEAAEEEEVRRERKRRREAERRERKETEKEKKHQEMEAEKMKKQQQAEAAFEEVLLSGHKKEEQMHQQRLGYYPQQAIAGGTFSGAQSNPAVMGIGASIQQVQQHNPGSHWGAAGGMEQQWHAGQWSSASKGSAKGAPPMGNGKGQPWGVNSTSGPFGKGSGSGPPSWPVGGGMQGIGGAQQSFRPPMSYGMPGPALVQTWR